MHREYYIQPINYVKLLNGQSKKGCCGPLDDKYYIFSFKPRGDYNAQAKYFFVGTHCANEFLDIIGSPRLPLFNPLINEQNHKPGAANSFPSEKANYIHPFNQELIKAINMLCISWNIIPETGLERVLSYTRRWADNPNYDGIVIFNRITSSDRKNRTLSKMINELRENNDIKEMKFDLLNQYLDSKEIENHIG